MSTYGPETYGERNADVYDEWHADLDPTDAVEYLADLIAKGPTGPVLELAVGTGRVTIPLAERGIDLRVWMPPRPWSPCSGPNPAASGSPSPSATWSTSTRAPTTDSP